MDDINWLSWFIILFMKLIIGLSSISYIVTLIVCMKRKKNLKIPTIIVAITITLSLIVGGLVALNDYSKDKWFYDMKSDIKEEYNYVDSMDYSMGRVTLSLFINCSENTTIDQTDIVLKHIAKELFLNSVENVSQHSYLKRVGYKYTDISIVFYNDNKDQPLIEYSSSYYTDGSREKVDNFTKWRKYVGENYEDFKMDSSRKED